MGRAYRGAKGNVAQDFLHLVVSATGARLAAALVDERDDLRDLGHGELEVLRVLVVSRQVLEDLAQQQRVLADALHRLDEVRGQVELGTLGLLARFLEGLGELLVVAHQLLQQRCSRLLDRAVVRVQLEIVDLQRSW